MGPLTREVLSQFSRGLLEDGVLRVLDQIVQPDTTRVVLLPQNGHQALVAGDHFEVSNG